MNTSVVSGLRKGGPGLWLALAAAFGTLAGEHRVADACGCLSPPAVTSGDYAVNQSAEQIIFEADEPGWVTAHILIKYAGKPESFAWIVPVPEAPELAISPSSAFGLIDKATTPNIQITTENICPTSAWSCAYHDNPSCGGLRGEDGDFGAGGGASSDAGAGATPEDPPVDIINEQVVGDYQTVTFRANEAAAATQWLRDNGFIVNSTTSIYMEPYVQANFVFVAAKLLPGAGVESIKPLRMHYRAAYPMVPLLLTAVAAEPHMTVTSYIYSDQPFRPQGHPVIKVDPNRIARDPAGRINYPQVLARTIDDAGGDAFIVEYSGAPVQPLFSTGGCCSSPIDDFCHLGGNDKCECPRDMWDAQDCAQTGDLVDGLALVDDLASKYTHLTRITTRVSAEEMRFDPTYERDYGAVSSGRLTLSGSQPSLASCESQVIDKHALQQQVALEQCSAVYCGIGGQCVTTASGPACACATGTVAQRFNDLDGLASVTCVPKTPTVDLRAGGDVLPDACLNVSCGAGSCIDRNGVAVCECNAGAAAAAGVGSAPRCLPVDKASGTPGATDFSDGLRQLDVCSPPPPSCGDGGWLVKTGSSRPGVDCGGTEPAAWRTKPTPAPTCDPWFGCGCQGGGDAMPTFALGGLVMMFIVGRKRRSQRA